MDYNTAEAIQKNKKLIYSDMVKLLWYIIGVKS